MCTICCCCFNFMFIISLMLLRLGFSPRIVSYTEALEPKITIHSMRYMKANENYKIHNSYILSLYVPDLPKLMQEKKKQTFKQQSQYRQQAFRSYKLYRLLRLVLVHGQMVCHFLSHMYFVFVCAWDECAYGQLAVLCCAVLYS